MREDETKGYGAKHTPGEKPDPRIAVALRERAPEGRVSCAEAFAVAAELAAEPAEVGKTADLLGMRLTHCQLGLFGYAPEKAIVKPADRVAPELEKQIREGLEDGRLSCLRAWGIAGELGLARLAVACAAEALGIRIRPCQLGAF